MTITPERIRAIREDLGLRRGEFAQFFKVSDSTISRWENGTARPEAGSLMIMEILDRGSEKAGGGLTPEKIRDAMFEAGAPFVIYLFMKELYRDMVEL